MSFDLDNSANFREFAHEMTTYLDRIDDNIESIAKSIERIANALGNRPKNGEKCNLSLYPEPKNEKE